MNQHRCTPLALLTAFAFHERLLADIAIDPSEIVPAETRPDSQAEAWATIAGTGLMFGAFIAMLIVRVKKARQRTAANSAEVPAKSGRQ